MFFKKKEKEGLEIEESNILCSKCYKKMLKVKTQDIITNICPECQGILFKKQDLEKVFLYFIRNEKTILEDK